jgi:ATP-dependent helicase/nuclease subunit B
MGVRFVFGRAGTGKTHSCVSEIVRRLQDQPVGGPIYWLLPRQATFEAERLITCWPGLQGYCRLRVLSFEQLGKDVLCECGGAAIPEITSLGRHMILGHLLRCHRDELRFFHRVAGQPGLAARFDLTLSELECCGKTPEDVQALLGQLSEAPADVDWRPLADKLHDVHLIYQAYCRYLGQERLDPHRRMEQVLQCIQDSRALRGSTVLVDGFMEFDPTQRRMLAAIAAIAAEVRITLLSSGVPAGGASGGLVDLGLWQRTQQTYQRLVKGLQERQVAIEAPLVLSETRRFASPALAAIERHAFEDASAVHAGAEGVVLLEAPDHRSEVDAAARHIRRLLDQGLRPRQITVLVRRLELYGELISASFYEHGIPYFMDHRRTMAHHPLLRMVEAIMAVAWHDWPLDWVMALLRCGLSGVSMDDADELENYVLEHRLEPRAWTQAQPWTYRRELTLPEPQPPEAATQCQRMDALRRKLVEQLSPLVRLGGGEAGPARPVSEFAAALAKVLEHFGVREALQSWISAARRQGHIEQADEHQQVWIELCGLLDQMVELLGTEPVSFQDFEQIIGSALSGFDLALAPPTLDQVLVGQVDRTRSPGARAAVVLGLSDGVFPQVRREASILLDNDRLELYRRDFDLENDAQRQLLSEHLLGYIALTRASESLYVSRSLCDLGGRALGPSSFWRQLRRLLPEAPVITLPRDPRNDASLVGTPRQLLVGLMQWARGGASADSAWQALYQWVATTPADEQAIDRLRWRCWPALAYVNEAQLSEVVARQLFASPLAATARQLERFAACPFAHFAEFGLGVQPRQDADPTAVDLGRAYHGILHRLVTHLLRQGEHLAELDLSEAEKLIDTCAADVAKALRGELMLGSARNRYLLGHIRRTVLQSVQAMKVRSARGQFQPAFSRLSFGGSSERSLPPLSVPTPRGGQVLVSGQIDRVDILEQEAAFAVLDYHMGDSGLNLGWAYHGLSLRLLCGLLAMRGHAAALTGRALSPAAALCVRLLREMEKVTAPTEQHDPSHERFCLTPKLRGLIDQNYVRFLDGKLQQGRSDMLAVQIKKDGDFSSESEVASGEQMAAILDYAASLIGKMADQINQGQIGIQPYRIGTRTPCPDCPYAAVCRFDPAVNHYRPLSVPGRAAALELMSHVQR